MNSPEPSDLVLLKAWTLDRDRQAIGELVRRHIDFVHAIARRRLGGDEHLADDVTQAVFILLLRKAHRIQSEAAMTSWLYTTTRYAAGNALKMLRRRKHHEEQGAQMAVLNQTDSVENSEMQPLLHEAIDQLTKTDRLCVVMSFLQEKTHGQVAAAMGLSVDAARKRISRSIERMREYLASRGTIVPSAAITSALAVKHAAVSNAFLQSTLNIAILSHSAEASGAAATIAKGVSQMIFATNIKIAAALAVALMVTGAVTAQAVKILGAGAVGPVAAQVQAPASQPSDVVVDKSTVDLGNGELVEFVGVSPYSSDDWHDINGQPINTPDGSRYAGTHLPAPKYKAMVRITCPEDTEASVAAVDANERGSRGGTNRLVIFDGKPGENSVTLEALIADGPWKSAMDTYANGGGVASTGEGDVDVSMSPLIDQNGKTLLYMSIAAPSPWRIVAIASDGSQTVGQPPRGSTSSPRTNLGGYLFDVQMDKIKRFQIQSRTFNKHVTAKNVCLDPNNPTQAQIVVDSK